jgi:hypothetical protein
MQCCMVSMLVADHFVINFQLPVLSGGGAQIYLECQDLDAESRSSQPRQPAHR